MILRGYAIEAPIHRSERRAVFAAVRTSDGQRVAVKTLEGEYPDRTRVAELERTRSGVAVVGLTGGVFQNRRLLELAAAGLGQRGFRVLLPERIPANDGGLSYGQVADFLGGAIRGGH